MFRRVRAGGLAAALLAAPAVPAVAGPTIAELVEVADITSLSVSPGGRNVVFRVERASIGRNTYSLDWYGADLETGTTLRLADGGGPIEGGAEPLAVEAAVWSSDERFVFHRALVDGAIGLWRTAIDGSGSRPALVADADVEGVAAGPGDGALTYVLGPSREATARAERREYDEGILVDGSVDLNQNLFRGGWVNGRLASQRMTGQWYTRAGLLWRAPRQRYRLDLRTLEATALGSAAPADPEPLTPAALDNAIAWEEAGRPIVRLRPNGSGSRLEVEDAERVTACAHAICRASPISWTAWRPGTGELAFATRDGHYRQALHLWDVARGTVRTAMRGEGLIGGSRDPGRPCALTVRFAVCVTASAVEPPRLERIDLASGARTVLFDPNAALRRRDTARVEQIAVPIGGGREAAGTVLLPRAPRAPAPLFVSYYVCPGYLRGSAGDEFPLAPLVDAGFVVACLNAVSGEDGGALADYRTGRASVEAFIESLVERGLVDRRRVGMGGFSFGSEVTMWTAMTSDLLAAAAVASPQAAPSSYWSNALPGRDFADVMRAFFGLGSPEETPQEWRRLSPALNAERIGVPLLMQLPENEARAQVELYARLARTPTPVELYAFPDENHLKFQPRHRAAAYRRSLDWFRYWLQGYVDPDRASAEQYRRWDAMRQKRDEAYRSNERSQASAEASSSRRM
jgi:dipeptidyl aminopeptidase/acylaminoacyl peptidase